MFEYKSEVVELSFVSESLLRGGKIDNKGLSEFDDLTNQYASEGWELVTYSSIITPNNLVRCLLVTFRKLKG